MKTPPAYSHWSTEAREVSRMLNRVFIIANQVSRDKDYPLATVDLVAYHGNNLDQCFGYALERTLTDRCQQ